MRSLAVWSLSALAIFTAVIAARLLWEDPVEQAEKTDVAPSYPIQRNIRYSYRIRNVSGEFLEKAQFWTYAPVSQTPTQRTLSIRSSRAYDLEVDQLGNQRMRFTLDNLPPYSTRTVTIHVRLGMSDYPNAFPASEVTSFLEPEKYIESDSRVIRSLAMQLRADKPSQTVAQSYAWVARNLQDQGYVQHDRGALSAMATKTGDCTEYMYLLMALNRSNGIATQGVAGFVVEEDAVLRPRDYHNWTLVLMDGLWGVVDPHKEVFMSNHSDYVAMRLLSGTQPEPAISSQTLFGTDAGVEVVMN